MAGWLALSISNDFCWNVGSLGDGWEMAWRTPVVLEHPIQTKRQCNTKPYSTKQFRTRWLGDWLWIRKTNIGVNLNRREMVGRWLDCGCDSRSLQYGREMISWLAPISSNEFVCNCRSPRDGWEMVGWLALVISNDFGWVCWSLGDEC